METFKTKKSCFFLFLVVLSSSICPGHCLSPAGIPTSEGNDAPLLASPPNDTPINKIPFAKPVRNQGQQSQLGYQQQTEPNYPQQSINQPLSGFNQPNSAINQPYSGFNQPFGVTNQQGSLENAAFHNGVSKEDTCIQIVVLVSLLALIVFFGFLV